VYQPDLDGRLLHAPQGEQHVLVLAIDDVADCPGRRVGVEFAQVAQVLGDGREVLLTQVVRVFEFGGLEAGLEEKHADTLTTMRTGLARPGRMTQGALALKFGGIVTDGTGGNSKNWRCHSWGDPRD